jgi:hypothetical protein
MPIQRRPGQHVHLRKLRPGGIPSRGRDPDRAARGSPVSRADGHPGEAQGRPTPPTDLPRNANHAAGVTGAQTTTPAGGTGRPGWLCQCPYAAHAQGLQGYPGADSVNSGPASVSDPLSTLPSQGAARAGTLKSGGPQRRSFCATGGWHNPMALLVAARAVCRFCCRTGGEHGAAWTIRKFSSTVQAYQRPLRDWRNWHCSNASASA